MRSALPLATSHSRTVLSPLPEASSFPSGEKATASTEFVWPLNARSSFPVATSHSSAVFPELTLFGEIWPVPAAINAPSGEKATD